MACMRRVPVSLGHQAWWQVPLTAEPSYSLVLWFLLSQNEWNVKDRDTDPLLQRCCRAQISCQPHSFEPQHQYQSTNVLDLRSQASWTWESQCLPTILHVWKTLFQHKIKQHHQHVGGRGKCRCRGRSISKFEASPSKQTTSFTTLFKLFKL